MSIFDDIEMVINASGHVAVFMLPVKSKPSSARIVGDYVHILSGNALVAKFEAPENYLERLAATGTVLVVECSFKITFRETEIPLVRSKR